eukprot:SAG11_NODE_28891_length_316_cov_1.751152_1_plen_43_part_10
MALEPRGLGGLPKQKCGKQVSENSISERRQKEVRSGEREPHDQ